MHECMHTFCPHLGQCSVLGVSSAFLGVLYAVKANDHPGVLKSLYEGGVRHFDACLVSHATLKSMFCETDHNENRRFLTANLKQCLPNQHLTPHSKQMRVKLTIVQLPLTGTMLLKVE